MTVGDGAEVVSDDHTWDDFSALADDPNILTCGNTAFEGDAEAPSFCLNLSIELIRNGLLLPAILHEESRYHLQSPVAIDVYHHFCYD